ncbi:MAG: hypothetical protein BGN86_10350 [Caulobacterales bacterium 68-7]|nr:hypothetical protein [Caulobacterales bacterium]OJU09632.1 MAG: hypothetical protein BGN86_10350 [Caulobacterales bacterium 68-7]
MSDDFDAQLGRLFNQAPAFPDNEAFAARVTARLDRDWTMRRIMIGVGGLAAGMVVAWQFVAGRFNVEVATVSSDAQSMIDSGVGRMMISLDRLSTLPAGGETLWLAAALGVAALAFGVTRAVESF